jgi:hypothetical protein
MKNLFLLSATRILVMLQMNRRRLGTCNKRWCEKDHKQSKWKRNIPMFSNMRGIKVLLSIMQIFLLLFSFIFISCQPKIEKVNEAPIAETLDTVVIEKDSIWLYVKTESAPVRQKPELLSETAGVLYYGDSVYGCYTEDSLWICFHMNGNAAFLKSEYLTSLMVSMKKTMKDSNAKVNTLDDVKRELKREFANKNIKLENDVFVYPRKKHTVIIPKNIKTEELGVVAYPMLKKFQDIYGLGGVKVCTDMSADGSTLYTSTAKEGTKMTFYTMGHLNIRLNDLVDTSKTLPARIMNGHVEFIGGKIK